MDNIKLNLVRLTNVYNNVKKNELSLIVQLLAYGELYMNFVGTIEAINAIRSVIPVLYGGTDLKYSKLLYNGQVPLFHNLIAELHLFIKKYINFVAKAVYLGVQSNLNRITDAYRLIPTVYTRSAKFPESNETTVSFRCSVCEYVFTCKKDDYNKTVISQNQNKIFTWLYCKTHHSTPNLMPDVRKAIDFLLNLSEADVIKFISQRFLDCNFPYHSGPSCLAHKTNRPKHAASSLFDDDDSDWDRAIDMWGDLGDLDHDHDHLDQESDDHLDQESDDHDHLDTSRDEIVEITNLIIYSNYTNVTHNDFKSIKYDEKGQISVDDDRSGLIQIYPRGNKLSKLCDNYNCARIIAAKNKLEGVAQQGSQRYAYTFDRDLRDSIFSFMKQYVCGTLLFFKDSTATSNPIALALNLFHTYNRAYVSEKTAQLEDFSDMHKFYRYGLVGMCNCENLRHLSYNTGLCILYRIKNSMSLDYIRRLESSTDRRGTLQLCEYDEIYVRNDDSFAHRM